MDPSSNREDVTPEARTRTESIPADQKPISDIVTDQASVLQKEAKAQSQAALDKLQAQAQTTFDKSRFEVAKQIRTMSKALRGGGQELRENSLGAFAVYPEQIAERIEDVSAYLQDRDRDAMRRDFEKTLEREPVLVLGGLAALGAAGMWYLKRRQRVQPSPKMPATEPSVISAQRRGP